MGIIARSPVDVMLGEMAYGVSDATRYADLQAIASVISNRATALNVTPQQVVAKQSEFNAYGKGLPPGASAYRDLAEAAWNDVATNGPTHTGMFYATPAAVGNLPKGLREVTEVEGGHRYFEDPHGRAIKTSVGYKAPMDLAATRAAHAQRLAFEAAAINGEDFATPQQRPDILNITQNPALLAGVPLSQFDPNISTGVPDISALTEMPNGALAQQIQATAPVATQQELDAAATRFGEDPSAMIASPADLAAALSRINTPAANPIDVMSAMDQAIAASIDASAASKSSRIGTGVDPARMADNAPLSDADKALQGMMKEAAADEMTGRFAGPARPITNSVQTTSIPGQVPSGSYVPGSMPVLDVSAVPARSVPTVSITPDMINSPEALSAALASIGAAPAMAQAEAVKGDRIGAIDTSAMDTSRFGQDGLQGADAALKSAISRATAPATQPTNNALQAAVDSAVRGPSSSLPSTDTALQAAVDGAVRGPVSSTFSMTDNQLQNAIDTAAKSPSPSTATQALAADAKAGRLPADDPTRDAMAKAAANPNLMSAQSLVDVSPALRSAPPTNILGVDTQLQQNGLVPDLSSFDQGLHAPQPAITATVPALETIEIAKQPTIAPAVDPAPVTKSVPAVTKSMPAVQQRQNTAMDVWSGKAQTGIATDGSTVSRLSGNKIGRYVPSFDYTVYSQDDGATWSSPVAGNQLAPSSQMNSQMASVQPAANRSLVSRLVSALTGITPASVSPTDVGPPMGLDGGMSIGRDGPAGAPGGWGPGGSISNPGSAGGYGSTKGKDPY